jgi:hypothetical protein
MVTRVLELREVLEVPEVPEVDAPRRTCEFIHKHAKRNVLGVQATRR